MLRIHKIFLKAMKRNSSNQNKTDSIEMELEVQIQKKLFLEQPGKTLSLRLRLSCNESEGREEGNLQEIAIFSTFVCLFVREQFRATLGVM